MYIQTTGGIFTSEIESIILANICRVFDCTVSNISELIPVQAGMTNIVLSFRYNGGRYIYRHPGLGSETLVNRGRETIMQAVVAEVGIDNSLIAMDVEKGWRISRYVEHRDFDYHNLNDMVRAVMLFNDLHRVPAKVRWDMDVIKKAEEIKSKIAPEAYGNFEYFNEIRERCYKLYSLAEED